MVRVPSTHYARDGDHHLAYQVASDNGPDLLYAPTATFPIDLLWDEPTVARNLDRLASFSRLILCDLVGSGSSDAVPIDERPAMQTWTDGLAAVLGAVGSTCASVFAMSESGLPAMMLAAGHPQLVRSLVLWSPYARFVSDDDQPFGMPEPTVDKYLQTFEEHVGSAAQGSSIDLLAPSWANDRAKREWWTRGERLSGGPGYFRKMLELFLRTDARPVLGSIQSPVLLMRRRGDRHVRDGHARLLAERIAEATLVELGGDDHEWFAGDADAVLDEIESFLTGVRPMRPTNRVLSTVLFTDIVGSTERASEIGDDAWMSVIDAHNRVVERQVAGARGVVVKYTGDGVLATFDGPARAILCARSIRDAVHDLGLTIRAGLHTGEVEMVGGDVLGIAVHIAARIAAIAAPDEVLVSGAIPPLVLGAGLTFDDRGNHDLKGIPQPWPVFAVRDEPVAERVASDEPVQRARRRGSSAVT
jgi:class 3 adenylate cyclase